MTKTHSRDLKLWPAKDFTGRILGYDPGGNGRHGVASLFVQGGHVENLAFDTVQSAQTVLGRLTQDTTPILGIGVDTLTLLTTGDAGWRPADRWLREQYPLVRDSIMPPNALQGAMALNGLAVIACLGERNRKILISETHPKVLYHHLTNGDTYNYEANGEAMNAQLAQWIGLPANIEDDHQWDAVASCLAVLRGITGQWLGDLHNQLPAGPDETLVQIVGPTHYYWPVIPGQAR